MMAQQSALSPQTSRIEGHVCIMFACSPCLLYGFPQELQFASTVQGYALLDDWCFQIPYGV